jgi:hypothetical protein
MRMAREIRATAIALVASVVGCNGILGWDAATLDAASQGGVCEQYCTAMDANCTGDNLKYISHDVCVKMCRNFDPGAPGDVSGDSQACRLHFAQQAATSDAATAAIDCETASPLGDGPCVGSDGGGGERCVAFCQLDIAYCGAGDTSQFPYTNETDCTTACAAYAYTAMTRVSADENQDTLNCRLYHLEAAYVDDQARGTHCPHTKQVSLTCSAH